MSRSVGSDTLKCRLTPRLHQADRVLHVLDTCGVQYSKADVCLSASGAYKPLRHVFVDVPTGALQRLQQYLTEQRLGAVEAVNTEPEGE